MDTVLYILKKLRSNLRGRETLSGPSYFLKPFLSHRQLIALYRRFSITLRFCVQFWWLTGCTVLWILLNISTNTWYAQTWALPFLHFSMAVNWPYIQSMQNIISVLHVPCFCNIMKCTNYLSFTKCFYHRILVLTIILDYHKSTSPITAMHWDWILQKV